MHELAPLITLEMGMIISPLPIIAVVAIVLSRHGRTAAPAFTAVFTLIGFVFTLGGALAASAAGGASSDRLVSIIMGGVLTVLFFGLAIASWIGRPKPGTTPQTPGWLCAADTITPTRAALLGLLMAITQTKNIPLELRAGTIIAAAHQPVVMVVVISLLFAVVGSLGMIIPTVLGSLRTPTTTRWLESVKSTLIAHNAIIMTVLFALLGANDLAHLVAALTR